MREIIFDTETTGLSARDGDRIIELGAVEMVNRFVTGKTFHHLISPGERIIHPDAMAVHGITDADVKDKPAFADIVDQFFEFVADGNLVAHNASFDMSFINAELKRLSRPPFPQDRVIDTLQIARRKHTSGQNSLDALCKRYGIDNSHRTQHGALLDSELLAEVYIELLGGKQTSLTLVSDQALGTSSSTTHTGVNDRKVLQRSKSLATRLSNEDAARHEKFVRANIERSLWLPTDKP